MSSEIVWTRGGHARVLERNGDRVVLRSTLSAPPGTPLEGIAEGAPAALVVKVRRCQRLADENGPDQFKIEGRLVNVSRTLRAYLNERFGNSLS